MSEYKKLREVGSIDTGFAFPSSSFSSFGTPVVRMSDLDDGSVDIENSAKILPAATKGLERYKLVKGQFLFGLSGSLDAYGTYQDSRAAYLNQRVGRLYKVDQSKGDYNYIRHILSSEVYHKHAYLYGSGIAQLNISPSQVEDLEFFCPPVPEQRLIARIFDTLDTQIQKTEAMIAKLEKVKEGLLHDLLTRGINENGQLRPSPELAPELYKESPLGLIPREWLPSNGAEACKEIVVGIVIKPTQYYRASGVPILRSANVRENRLSLDNLMYMSQQDHKAMSKSAVKFGDVLTVRTGYPGTSCVVDGSIEEANCVDIIISRVGEGLDPKFWSLWINSDFGKGHVLKSQGGLAQQHFNVGDLKKIQFPLPTMTEQLRIVGSWRALQKQIQQETTQLAKIQFQKHSLMDDLLTGRVRVTPLLDQAKATTPA